MSKIVVLLALYAAAVSTILLLQGKGGGATGHGSGVAADAGSPDIRRLMGEARSLMRAEVKETLKNIDWRLSRMADLHKSMEAGLMAAQRTAEDAAGANYGKLEALEETVSGFGKATAQLESIREKFASLEKRLAAVESRPAQVIREIRTGGGPPTPGNGTTEPKGPRLPVEPTKDPAIVAAEIAKAKQDIQGDDIETLFPAIEKIREHRVLEAVPRLLQILASHKDEFGRAAAAAALGKMQVADAVPGLLEALIDKSDLVAQQANQALREITEFDTELPSSAGIRTRRTARTKAKEWWRAHEAEVRERLGQPRPEPEGGG